MNIVFPEDEAERKTEMLCDLARNILDEWESGGKVDGNLVFRVGMLASLAHQFSEASPKAHAIFRRLSHLIDKMVYNRGT